MGGNCFVEPLRRMCYRMFKWVTFSVLSNGTLQEDWSVSRFTERLRDLGVISKKQFKGTMMVIFFATLLAPERPNHISGLVSTGWRVYL